MPHPSSRGAHAGAALSLFAGLGFHVGLWAVLIPDVAAAARLTPSELGGCIGLVSLAGMAALLAGGPVSDRLGRRPVALAGGLGLAAAFALLASVGPWPVLIAGLVLLGCGGGLLDLAANATGSDYERAHHVKAMTGLHGAFSAAAAAGALSAAVTLAAGATFRAAFAAGAVLLAALGLAALKLPLPPRDEHPPVGVAGGAGGVPGGPAATGHPATPDDAASARAAWRVPAVRLGVALAAICFLGDGMLEGFTSLYLRGTLASGALLGGAAIAAFHLASLAGRIAGAKAVRVRGEQRTIRAAGTGAAAGMAVTVLAPTPALAAVGLLLVGLALAPVVPTAISVAGRGAPGRAGAAVSLVSTAGYGAFIAGPALTGVLAGAASLRLALAPVVLSAVAIALLGGRLPAARSTRAR